MHEQNDLAGGRGRAGLEGKLSGSGPGFGYFVAGFRGPADFVATVVPKDESGSGASGGFCVHPLGVR